jgi:hypothetical protein
LKRALALLLCGFLAPWSAATAKTPDGRTPAEETVCDSEVGAAFGLCNAYCEAMDCDDPEHRASEQGCASVKRQFERRTGRPMPCEVTCPCATYFPLFADLGEGIARIELCVGDDQILSVITPEGTFAVVNGAVTPPFCSLSLEPPLLEITSAQALACRDFLRRASAAQGVPCVSPE